jgi:hypothetical protein
MLDEYHQEIKDNVLSKCLYAEDSVTVNGQTGTFKELPKLHCGRLGGPGVEPGIYTDRTRAIVEIDGKLHTHLISDISLEPALLDQRLTALQKREPTWYLISWASDFTEDLPDTEIIEGDIVRLTDDTHEHYNTNPDMNQFAVNRIKYGCPNNYGLM